MSATKITFLLAIAGHLLCGVSDCLLTYTPGGRFHYEDIKDNDRLSAVFKGMPLRNSLLSMLLGCLAMFLFSFGYSHDTCHTSCSCLIVLSYSFFFFFSLHIFCLFVSVLRVFADSFCIHVQYTN